MGDWDDATHEERMLAVILTRPPLWLRLAMRVTVYLPGKAGAIFDALERYRNERSLREWREAKRKRVHWS